MKDGMFISFSSDLTKMKETLDFVVKQIKLKRPLVSDDELTDLRLIFAELFTNAVIHGNHCDARKKVYVNMEFHNDGIRSKITDEGNGFDYLSLLIKREMVGDLFAESGRGVLLVKALTDELVYVGRGNVARFFKKFAFIPADGEQDDRMGYIHYLYQPAREECF